MVISGRSGIVFLDSITLAVLQQVRTSCDDAGAVLKNLWGASENVSSILHEVRDDIAEAERIMKTFRQSWIYRQIASTGNDPLLKWEP